MPKLPAGQFKRKKHYRPPGKKREGNAAKFITRTRAVHHLQLSLPMFRKLCILKGIFPRVPKKKVEGNHKTYYHMKDINFLAHEPLLDKFRDLKAYDRKIKKAVAKKNKDLANRLKDRRPAYHLDPLIKQRYPRFVDALRDLDDCLTMVQLFASLPATESTRIDVKRIHNCRRLCHEWMAYIARTHCLRKTFISVKGIYYQAEIEGQKITWLTPHALQQVVPDDVDFNVLLTFLEFYETLLSFVNFRLYHSINMEYPPVLDPLLEAEAADLYALYRLFAARSRSLGNSQTDGSEEQNGRQNSLPNKPGALMHLVEDACVDEDKDDEDTKECRSLFKNMIFFLGREVPKDSLLFVIPAFGGTVSWEGDGSPLGEADERITHQIVDRPSQGHVYLSRDYVQPQWIYDCVNARIILPIEAYMVGRVPPPHLSPFVDNEAEGYVPEYAETIKRLQAAAKREVLPMSGADSGDLDDPQRLLAEGVLDRAEAQEAAERKQKLMELEKQYHEELRMEAQGMSYAESLSRKGETKASLEREEKGEETTVGGVGGESSSLDTEQMVAMDAASMSKVVMSRKKRKLYEAMQISKERKRSNVQLLKERKKKAEKSS
ncbi:pescadillo-like protein [Wolffia australiana]